MDLFLIRGIGEELKKEICGGFINKIYQLNRYDLLLRIRRQGQEKNLLISTHPDYSRWHLTEKKYVPPPTPPRFSAYLRKHVHGARVVEIVQEPYERIMRLHLEKLLDANLIRKLTLVVELLGKKSNVFLVEGEKILEALHRSPIGEKEKKENIPGKNYVLPQMGNKLLPPEVTREVMGEIASFPIGEQWRVMVQKIAGLSPLLAKEIELVSGGDPHKMWENFCALWARYNSGRFEPQIVTLLNGKKILCPWSLRSLQEGSVEFFSSLNLAADNFYYEVTTWRQVIEQKQSLLKRVRQLLERLQKRKENLLQDREKLTKDLQLKAWGDILV
ncbi:MAG: NFACT family protein, partial [Thermodesulfobacteriota bacterium]